MSTVWVAIDDALTGAELVDALEKSGHRVSWVPATDVGPDGGGAKNPDVIVLDGDEANVSAVSEAWQGNSRAPRLLVMGAQAKARIAADRTRALFLSKPVSARALEEAIARAGSMRPSSADLGIEDARAKLGLAAASSHEEDAARIIAAAQGVDLQVVRETLKPRVHEYVVTTPLARILLDRGLALGDAARLLASLDGARTVKHLVDTGVLEPGNTAQLLWAFLCTGAAVGQAEPPSDRRLPKARAVATMRDHVRARRARLVQATHYDVLELSPEASVADVDRACQVMAVRFSPEALSSIDMGDMGPLVSELWQDVLKARAVLTDPRARTQYDESLLRLQPDADPERLMRRLRVQEAETAFVRGQKALLAGNPAQAVAELSAAARRVPEEPDYEAFCAWARFQAGSSKGEEKTALARRERGVAEASLLGRRPRPRALLALAFLCEAEGDLDSARDHLRATLACDPRLITAQKALERLGGKA